MHSRRSFFRLLAAAPALRLGASQKLIVRSANPEDFEMPLDGFQTWLTPVDRFFVRTHLYRPAVKMDDWRLRISGEVEGPLALAMGDLRKLPRVELVSVLECAGNGRGLYRPTVPGIQWRYGAVGNARWAGVRLPDVLKRARLKPSAKHILFNGADVPMGTVPDFARSLPVEKAMHPDTLLAWEMNGAPLTPSHGFPLRLVAPGWAGDSWVKWVTEIQAMEHEYDGFFMKMAYRRPVKPVAPGTAVDPAQMVPVTDIKIKSLIASPQEGEVLGLAPVRVQGAAWSGAAPVARVEFSANGGKTWSAARLGREQSRYAWRLWEADWKPAGRGAFTLMARATDESGAAQSMEPEWNPSGYLWNAVHQVRVRVGEAYPPLPANVKVSCVGCHGEDIIAGQRLTRAQWEREIDKMVRWGAAVKPEERPAMIDFLARHFKPE